MGLAGDSSALSKLANSEAEAEMYDELVGSQLKWARKKSWKNKQFRRETEMGLEQFLKGLDLDKGSLQKYKIFWNESL